MIYGHGRKHKGMTTALTGGMARGRRLAKRKRQNVRDMMKVIGVDYV
jgi:hypothetical protein